MIFEEIKEPTSLGTEQTIKMPVGKAQDNRKAGAACSGRSSGRLLAGA